MPISLATLASQKRLVETSQGEAEVWGLKLGELLDIIDRFPALFKLMVGEDISPDIATLFMVRNAPELAAALIATAMQSGAQLKEAEAGAMRLPPGDQLKLVNAVLDLTMPGGFGPFVETLRGLGLISVSAPDVPPNAPVSPSPRKKRNRKKSPDGRVGDTTSSMGTTSSSPLATATSAS